MKTRDPYLFALSLILLLSIHSYGQLQVNTNVTANQLMQSLIGSGLAVSNVTLNCNQGAYATFTNGNTTSLGINNGIILATGSADSAGAPASFFSDDCYNTNADPNPDTSLTNIDPQAKFDICVLEFDLLPQCDTLAIRFAFGSEEYPNFVNSINDLFGFFINGFNPAGGNYVDENIAVIPGNIPVSINNINNGNNNNGPCTNCAYYIDNSSGSSIVYDGMTVVITSSIALYPCLPYHFKLAIADASDCILNSGVFVEFITCSSVFTTTTNATPEVCSACNGTAEVNIQGGVAPYIYQWLPSGGQDSVATNLCAGTYTVLVMDINSCGIPDTNVIVVPAQNGIPAITQQTNALCSGDCNGTITVNPNGGTPPYTYSWTPSISSTNSAGSLCAGNYSVLLTDSIGCSGTYTFNITDPPLLTVQLAGTDTICQGDSSLILSTVAGGTTPYTYTWSNAVTTPNQYVSPPAATVYNLSVVDSNGCTASKAYTVTVENAPLVNATASPGACAPVLINFTNTTTGATIYQWDFGDPASGALNNSTATSPSHNYAQGGVYTATLIGLSSAGCTDTFQIQNINAYPNPTADVYANEATVSEFLPQVIFNDISSGSDACILYFGDGESVAGCNLGIFSHTYPGPGTYEAIYITTTANGCVDTASITIVVEQETSIYIPNAFSPDGNGINDLFGVTGINVNDYELLVFNRWGTLIDRSASTTDPWDGNYFDQKCESDVYVWKLTYKDSRGELHKLYGHVTLIR